MDNAQDSPQLSRYDLQLYRRSVLVCVMNNIDDMQRAASEGWYRIPQRRAPQHIGADYLAFYQTGKFKGQPEAQTVTFFAATRRYRLLTRAELIPDEVDHKRAEEYYFRIDIGPLQRLERSIPAAKMRRLTFARTTMEHLFAAQDVQELFLHEDPIDKLWKALRHHRLRPLKNRIVGERPMDITLRARSGYLGIRVTDDKSLRERNPSEWASPVPPIFNPASQSERWEFLHLSPLEIEQDLNDCLRRIGRSLITLGGSALSPDSAMPVKL